MVKDNLSDRIPGLVEISLDEIGNIILKFNDESARDVRLKLWAEIDGIKKAIQPEHCIVIDEECSSDILNKMLPAIQIGFTTTKDT
jgi:hypothetical protein